MKSFIGWIGGKNHLKNLIIPLIPDECDRYIEVCGGAGWVLFGKEQKKEQMEVFNDIDGDLINLYRVIKYKCDDLQNEIDWLHSRELFKLYRYEIEHQIPLSDVQRAARYLYLIKSSFGSNRYSFATSTKNLYKIIDDLPAYKDRLKSVVIEQLDFEKLINTYDRNSSIFFVYSPYVGSEKYYNKKFCQFTLSDHIRLNTCLKSIKGRFILTYNDCEFVYEYYRDFNIQRVSRKNLLPATQINRGEYKEVIITNY